MSGSSDGPIEHREPIKSSLILVAPSSFLIRSGPLPVVPCWIAEMFRRKVLGFVCGCQQEPSVHGRSHCPGIRQIRMVVGLSPGGRK